MVGCSVPCCKLRHYAKGLCKSHYYKISTNPGRKRNPCSIPECSKSVYANGLCMSHYRKSPAFTSTTRICRKCGAPYTKACKPCHAKKEANRRARLSPEKRAARLQGLKEWNSNFRKTLSSKPLEKQVYYWAKRVLKRASKGGQYQSRSVIPLDVLITIALRGLRRFPYMNFSSTQRVDKIADRASLDRIDPKGQYEIINIRVVPLWLNMAKCDLTDGEFESRLKQYLAQKDKG